MAGDFALLRRIVANDLRLFCRGGPATRLRWFAGGLGRVLVLALLHLPAFALVFQYAQVGGGAGGAELASLFLLLALTTVALHRSLEVLYNRGDLALLLASPVPARVVLLTRLLDVLLTTLLGGGTLLLPLLDAAIVVVGARWAFGLLAFAGAALVVTPLALLAVLQFVGRFGARRARTLVQVLGILLGMGAFAAIQAPNWLGAEHGSAAARLQATARFLRWFEVPPLTALAAAASGAVAPLLLLCGSGLLLCAVAFRALGRAFTAGAQGAAGDVGAVVRRGAGSGDWLHAFRLPRWRALLRKEVLLLRRDPLLLLRCSMQIMSLVPALLGMLWLQRAAGLAGLGLVATAMVAVQLAALMTINDEAHEFVAASPLLPRERAWARAAAAAAPLWLFGGAIAVAVVWFGSVRAAALIAVGAAVNSLAMAWLGACTVRPRTAEERARNRPPRIAWQTFLAMFVGSLGSAGVGLLEAGMAAPGLLLFLGALGAAGLVFLIPPRAEPRAA